MLQAVRRSCVGMVLVGVCAGSVAACHKKPQTPPPAPVAKPVPPSETLPARQPGLWQTTVTEQGSEDMPQILQICIDKLTDQHLGILGTDLSGDKCAQKTVRRLDDGSWGLLAQCSMGTGVTDEYSGSITGDYTQDYSMKLRAQTTNVSLPQMNRVTNYTVVSKRLGDCGADQKPGDVINDGVKVNLFDMSGIQPPGTAKKGAAAAPAASTD